MVGRNDPKFKIGCQRKTGSTGFSLGAPVDVTRCNKRYSLYTIDKNDLADSGGPNPAKGDYGTGPKIFFWCKYQGS